MLLATTFHSLKALTEREKRLMTYTPSQWGNYTTIACSITPLPAAAHAHVMADLRCHLFLACFSRITLKTCPGICSKLNFKRIADTVLLV